MAMRSNSDRPPGPIRTAITTLIAAPWILALVWPMALIVVGAIAWSRYGQMRTEAEFQGIQPNHVTISTPPEYIRGDITSTVFRDTWIETVSVLQPTATAKIASAYSLHPWVREVTSVRKLPGGTVDVRIEYRDVAAMVRTFEPGSAKNIRSSQPVFFPVDSDGMLVPSQDFSSAQTIDYIHIDIPGVYSRGAVGTPFGEPRVESAASLAGLLHPHRGQLGIESITVFGDGRRSITPQFEIHLTSGETLFWGSPPGREPSGEADAESKLRWMLSPSRNRNDDLRWAGRSRIGR